MEFVHCLKDFKAIKQKRVTVQPCCRKYTRLCLSEILGMRQANFGVQLYVRTPIF
jgi:hypothetical protein